MEQGKNEVKYRKICPFYNINKKIIFHVHQFSMLAERLALEREKIQVRKKAQEKVSSAALQILQMLRTCEIFRLEIFRLAMFSPYKSHRIAFLILPSSSRLCTR